MLSEGRQTQDKHSLLNTSASPILAKEELTASLLSFGIETLSNEDASIAL